MPEIAKLRIMCAAPLERFPEGFTWGTATAAHQIEGGNANNDWWAFEHRAGSGTAEPSGDACDSYHRWREDADIVASLGLDNYRFSLEWSRIEPADGEFSQAALDHYARVCEGLKERGIDPVVTFHHFTTPQWLVDQGGWERPETAERFAVFVEKAAARLDGLMSRACTINEPNVVAVCGWLLGFFPPGKQEGSARAEAVSNVFIDAHRQAVSAVRSSAPGTPVGLTLSMAEYVAVDGAEERMAKDRRLMEDIFLDATGGDDFIGVQTYSRHRVGPNGMVGAEEGVPTLAMGYEYWPQALEATLRRAWDYTGGQTPLLVTENGIGTDDDTQRIAYLGEALAGVLRAMGDGVDVRGYTCWSLLDNFEWAFGYRPKFGLVGVDRTTFARTPKPSAQWLSEVARSGSLPAY
ncbi:MAG: family 1 glycosylhydrolase [Aquihabitans sp.]